MLTVSPSIAPEIYRIAPGFRVLSICVKAAPVLHPDAGEIALREACEAVVAGEPEWAGSHLAAWADVFQKLGAKPKRTPCSADALRKRVLRDGTMPALDPIVDLYNAVSLRYAVPVGGENISAYQGSPRLAVANGTEPFDTVKEGETAVEYPSQGEVIWCDDTGATCRRWNWRQGIRTRLGVDAQQMWFILESLPQMPLEKLHEAGKMLTDGLEKMMPGLWFDVALIEEQQQ
ncbi:TPA: B3/4 domain-containing protein [Klebsiella pneumoniae]|uniref:B3/B4 domain-containing protein n=1 Tax=Klebsiella pneumoniae TaxID=573 RepID=UPI0007CD229B|nr:B3/4 domain-containing protein [Klebsiella pneumoniae]SBI78282.1 B3/4 domain-containing protein [Klebsiella pneumoniae]HBQ0703243.1 B3/4 domain-containing protein [Klebsiella pneumoniae]HBW5137975.1 B3/4 domain-containing protein [Klebsiella pneumoniae]HBW5391757.1 B3/4 domain-containing protein [Klebsiella pneumoniae]HBW5397028.1 B3/4 domain-containing protein [Klebsiella pneumoniae]